MDSIWLPGKWTAVLLGLIAVAITVLVRRAQKEVDKFRAAGLVCPGLWEQVLYHLYGVVGKFHIGDIYDSHYAKLKAHKVAVVDSGRPILLVSDPGLVQQVLIKDFSAFHDRGFTIDVETNPLEGHLFSLSGDKWRTLRNKLSPTFTSGKLKGMYSLMTSCGEALIGSLDKRIREATEAEGSADLEVTDILACFTTDVIGSCAFGYEPSAVKDPDCEFRRMGRRMFRPTLFESVFNFLRFVFPRLIVPLKIRSIPKEVNDFFYDITRKGLEHRAKTGEKRNDFLQLLLQLKQKGSVEIDHRDVEDNEDEPAVDDSGPEATMEFTDDVLTAQAFVFFAAGFETSATTMSFTLYCLSKNQGAQDKARQEVREMKRKHGAISYAALKDMPYLEACLNESLRMYSPIRVLFRQCTKNWTLGDGTRLQKGWMVAVPVTGLQNDPRYFPRPEAFEPERFCAGNTFVPGTFMPFGDGPRICIAKRFAVVEAKMGLAQLLDSYVIRPSLKQEEPIKLNARAFITQPTSGIFLNFTKI